MKKLGIDQSNLPEDWEEILDELGTPWRRVNSPIIVPKDSTRKKVTNPSPEIAVAINSAMSLCLGAGSAVLAERGYWMLSILILLFLPLFGFAIVDYLKGRDWEL